MTAPFSLSNLLSSLETTATTDVQTWLVAQYAALQAMPKTLSTFANAQAQLVAIPAVASDPAMGPTLSGIGSSIQSLIASYPAMIGPVNNAYGALALARSQGVSVTTGADIAIAVAGAQQFMSGVSTVQTELIDLVNAALSSGAITPAQASSLTASVNAPNGTGWLKYAGYALGAYVLYRIIKKVL